MRFTDLSLHNFWISVIEDYPAIHRKAINILLQFSTSYTCEQASSCLTKIKSKDRNCFISAEDNSMCAYLKFNPELSICATKNKEHVSN
jgi:hypothetical protein